MALRLGAVLPRLVLVLLAFALGTATLTFAAAKQMSSQTAPPVAAPPAQPVTLVVPDVDKQAYVFAKGDPPGRRVRLALGPGARGFAPYTVDLAVAGAGDAGRRHRRAARSTLRLARDGGLQGVEARAGRRLALRGHRRSGSPTWRRT